MTVLPAFEPRSEVEATDLLRLRALSDDARAWDRATPLHLTGSALVVHPPSKQVLLRWHAREQAWLQVGGHADPGEHDALSVALREAREETGLDDLVPWPSPSIVHVVIVHVTASTKEAAHEHADIRFVLATSQPERARAENEQSPLRWMTIDEAFALTAEDNVRVTLERVRELMERQ